MYEVYTVFEPGIYFYTYDNFVLTKYYYYLYWDLYLTVNLKNILFLVIVLAKF